MFALKAFKEKQYTRYTETLLMVNSIIVASNNIVSALQGEQAPSNSLQDLLSSYKELLMPEFVEEREAKAKKVKKIMEQESAIGAFVVEPMVHGERSKKGLN